MILLFFMVLGVVYSSLHHGESAEVNAYSGLLSNIILLLLLWWGGFFG